MATEGSGMNFGVAVTMAWYAFGMAYIIAAKALDAPTFYVLGVFCFVISLIVAPS